MIPQDPMILLSFLNQLLRDKYRDLEQLCEDMELTQSELTAQMAGIDYHYDKEQNQFK
ncbi:MAG: DUF4250 domain-containing protein [Lachnospiraceae bacterium]